MSEHLEHLNAILDELSLAQLSLDQDNLLDLAQFLNRLEEFGALDSTPEINFILATLTAAVAGLIKGQADFEILGERLGEGLSLIQEIIREGQISGDLSSRLEKWAGLTTGALNTSEPGPAFGATGKTAPAAGPETKPPPLGHPLKSGSPEAHLPLLLKAFSTLVDKIQVALVNMEQSRDPIGYLPELAHYLQLSSALTGFLNLPRSRRLSFELWTLVEDVQAELIAYDTQVADLLIAGSSGMAEAVKKLYFEEQQVRENETGLPEDEWNALLSRFLMVRQCLGSSGHYQNDRPDAEDEAPRKLGEILVERGAVSATEISNLMRSQDEKRSQKLGDLLLEAGLIKAEDLQKALEIQGQDPNRKVGEILVTLGVIDPDIIEALLRNQEANRNARLGELLVRSKVGRTAEVAEALREQRKSEGNFTGATPMVKVETRKLDGLIDLVGELVIAQSLINTDKLMGGLKDQKLIRNLAQVTRITSELQRNAMGMRMVQVSSAFQKMQRLTRDLSQRLDKPVDLQLIGADTEIDRNMVETLYDPLVHMVRNAMDHGIELAGERRAAGKPSSGRLTLRACHQGGNVLIELTDDGRGLDADEIRAKAQATGLIGAGEQPNDQAAYSLLFQPGFSTSPEVTDISGRGLGMSVVKQAIERLRGKIDLSSTPGKFTTVTIRLPLTLAIIDGMIVRVGEHRYILPTVAIKESFRPQSNDFFTVKNQGEVIRVRNQLVPLLRLSEVVEAPTAGRNPDEALVVVVENEGQLRCLLVDEVIGKQEVVIKSLGERLKHVKALAGGTILGDGQVGLILDVAGLFAISSDVAAYGGVSGTAQDQDDDDWGMGDAP